MSKLAHSNTATMLQIEFNQRLKDGDIMTSRRLHARPALTTVLLAALHEELRDAVNSDALAECREHGWLESEGWELTRDGKRLIQQMGLE